MSEANDEIDVSTQKEKLSEGSGSSSYLEAIIGLQVDDSLISATAPFLVKENREVARFAHKPFVPIDKEPLSFNGATISKLPHGGYALASSSKIAKLSEVQDDASFVSMRALGAYVSIMSRPDLSGRYQPLAGNTQLSSLNRYKKLNKLISYTRTTADQSLSFVPLDLEGPLRLIVFTDTGFNTHKETGDIGVAQLGYVIVLVDQHDVCNTIAYCSKRCKRVTRSVLAAELFGLVEGFDAGSAIVQQVQQILERSVELWTAPTAGRFTTSSHSWAKFRRKA